ncbi:SHQ1 protein-domain-containing protein [Scheffersomyces coipomensis]|uniref:SHQ1 protein-domain-containing protein n=1 Tax=Scheffersomyces coipomensis TaxID=1788519 RepID=UPI00315D3868
MITPFFSITQDDEFIYIDIKVSHIRFNAKSIEFTIDEELFIFSLPPYYLRLRLPFPLADDEERSNATFEGELIKVKVPKLTKGQFFHDLDLTSKLLARSTNVIDDDELKDTNSITKDKVAESKTNTPLIQELDVSNEISNTRQVEKDFAEGEKFNWEIEQKLPEPDSTGIDVDPSIQVTKSVKYGFDNQYDSIIGVSQSNGNDINELGDSEHTAYTDRIVERLIKENIKFDPEYYAADYIMEKYPTPDDDKIYKDILEWKNPLVRQFLKWYKTEQSLPENERTQIMPVSFTKDEQEKMLNLPKKSYLVEDKSPLLLLLVSLLFAYHFDLRENEGDHNIESAWTAGKIIPQFSFLDSQIIIQSDNVLRASTITLIRRALSYPYHRNYNLISKVWDDVYYNLRGGKRLVLKALLDLKELFRFHDVYYVYDKIWLEDFVTWFISDDVTEAMIRNLAHDLKKEYSTLSKSEITFEKVQAPEGDEDDDDDEDLDLQDENDNIIALNLREIEAMAEDMYQQQQQ